jgi:hypothetical protein
MKFRTPIPSPSMLVALAALVFALGGGAYAAGSKLISGSSIKNGTITLQKLAPSIRTKLNRRVTVRGAAAGIQGPQGLPGTPGPPGPPGAPGANGGFDPNKVTTVVGPPVSAAPGQILSATAICPPGAVALGGGYFSNITHPAASEPLGTFGWAVIIDNDSSIVVDDLKAYVVCGSP